MVLSQENSKRSVVSDMLRSSGERVFMTRIVFEWLLIDGAVSYVFYKSIPAFMIFLPGMVLYFRFRCRQRDKAEKSLLSMQFRESILSVSTALNAGYSVENAFIEAYHDMQDMYGEDARITSEYRRITARLRDNEQIEYILKDFAESADIPDISDFAGIFEAAKRIGGDMTRIIRQAASNISDKIEVRREIEVSMSSKITETRIMEAVPFGILVYPQIGSADFLSVLYENTGGRVLMTAALAVYLAGVVIAERILDIEV